MDESVINLKYLKCKYKVKKWECDFKKENGVVPSKVDIKSAPAKIKDAYRIYWMLKTRALENSISIDEDTQDCFGLDLSCAANTSFENFNGVNLSETIDNSAFNILVNESTAAVVCDKSSETVSKGECGEIAVDSTSPSGSKSNASTKIAGSTGTVLNKSNASDVGAGETCKNDSGCSDLTEEVNSKNVWGAHLNFKKKEETVKKVRAKPALSYSFSEKLFKGFNFKKRNPRKSLKKKKSCDSVSGGEMNGTDNVKANGTLNISDETKSEVPNQAGTPFSRTVAVNQKTDGDETEESASVFNIFNEKVKVLIKSTPVNSQPLNISQTAAVGKVSAIRSFNKGWLERTNINNKFSSTNSSDLGDSGIDSGESSIVNTPSPLVSAQTEYAQSHVDDTPQNFGNDNVIDSDDDLVCNSDSENENSRSVFHTASFMVSKRPLAVETGSKRTDGGNDEREFKRLKSDHCGQPAAVLRQDSFVGSSSSPSLKPTVGSAGPCLESRYGVKEKTKPTADMTDTERKEALLLKKVTSGKANNNFVRINIQKKVFVRGKKTMNFSNYKKQQWKKKKGYLANCEDGDATGLLKCFKCGDVGHFSRNCFKGMGKLVPKEDIDDMEDECVFPTLQDAEEMAKMAADRMCFKKRKSIADAANGNQITGCADLLDGNDEEAALIEAAKGYDLTSLEGGVENGLKGKQCVQPVFKLNEDGTVADTPLVVNQALLEFGHTSFRPGQEEAVMRILSGLSTLVTLSTGSGKSLCYQLPAYLFSKLSKEPCITIVVSPLISLMEDQVVNMSKSPIKIGCFHMNQTKKQRENLTDLLKAGNMDVLMVSPEVVVSSDRLPQGRLLHDLPPVAFACIDEVHCISQWSHNFRPSYLMLCKVLEERFGVKTFLGLTATATKTTVSGIVKHLRLPDGADGVITDIPLPKNLTLSVSKDKDKDQALVKLLQSGRFCAPNSVIVYCTRREECERVAAHVRTSLQAEEAARSSTKKRGRISVTAEPYHAGLTPDKRKRVQKAFMSGELRIVVATIAFGMGINKHNIRGIVHYNMPSTFESYVQEVGRAGRDGAPAHCHLFLDSQGGDLNELRRHVFANSMDRHTIRKLLQRVFVPCKCPEATECRTHEVAFSVDSTVQALDLKEESIATLLCYLELHPKKWVTNLQKSYTVCRVQSYKGAKQLVNHARKCPPLALAVARELSKGTKKEKLCPLSFAVVELASAIGWDSGSVKYHLKQLEWSDSGDGIRYKTGLLVEFSDLGFRVQAPGNLCSEELDFALDSLHQRVKEQEATALSQLQGIFQALTLFSCGSVDDCLDGVDMASSDKLKIQIREYFEKPTDALSPPITNSEEKLNNEDQVAADVRNLVASYRDCSFTGRAIARVFHGIASPNFPALMMGRNRWWRAHLHEDFNLLSALATKILLRMR